MGFHKRYIDDRLVIRLYQSGGVDAVIRCYTGKVDALILSGTLSEEVDLLMNELQYNRKGVIEKISSKIRNMSIKED